MRSDRNNPINRIAARFGGTSALARQVGVDQVTVWDWVHNGLVPSRQIPVVIKAGRRRNPPVILTPNDFFDCEQAP